MVQRPTLASNIWPHLQTDKEPAQSRRERSDLASTMWPSLSREARQQSAEWERRKQSLLKHLRELNDAIDARLARERR
jgi:hypothetical protein